MNDPVSTEKPVVLVVDDTPENLALMSALLRDEYVVRVANSGVETWVYCSTETVS